MKKNSTKKFWRVATRCLLIIATVVAMLSVTSCIGKAFTTQVRLGLIYNEIQSAESARIEFAERAQEPLGSGIRGYYQSQADGYDEEVKRLTQKRYDIMHSDDAIIEWSAKDGFEYSIFLPSLASMAIIVLLWVQWYKHMEYVTEIEEMIICFIVFSTFYGLSIIFGWLKKFSYQTSSKSKSHFWDLYDERSNSKIKKKKNSRNKVIKFDSKKQKLG